MLLRCYVGLATHGRDSRAASIEHTTLYTVQSTHSNRLTRLHSHSGHHLITQVSSSSVSLPPYVPSRVMCKGSSAASVTTCYARADRARVIHLTPIPKDFMAVFGMGL